MDTGSQKGPILSAFTQNKSINLDTQTEFLPRNRKHTQPSQKLKLQFASYKTYFIKVDMLCASMSIKST